MVLLCVACCILHTMQQIIVLQVLDVLSVCVYIHMNYVYILCFACTYVIHVHVHVHVHKCTYRTNVLHVYVHVWELGRICTVFLWFSLMFPLIRKQHVRSIGTYTLHIQLNTHITNQKFRGNLFVISRSLLYQDNFL